MDDRIDFTMPGIYEHTNRGTISVEDVRLRITNGRGGLLLKIKFPDKTLMLSLDEINERADEMHGRNKD